MNMRIATRISVVVMVISIAACASKGPQKELEAQDSGFLGDYSKLQWDKDAQGNPVRTWVSPKLVPSSYDAILLEPLKFYPEPRSTEQVSAEDLQKMVDYANEALKRELGKRFTLVDQPRAGAVRLRAAISGVAAEGQGLSAYQYVPIAFVATMTKRAVAGTPQRAFIVSESELRDSLTDELLAQRVKVGTGAGGKLEKIAGEKRVTLKTVKPLLDELAAAALPNLETVVKPKASGVQPGWSLISD